MAVRVVAVALSLACGMLASCSQPRVDPARDAGAADAGAIADAEAGAEDEDAGKGEPQKLAATNFQVSVVDRMAWPESGTGAHRLGYLRAGDIVLAYDRAIPNDECVDGWIELASGGWVCGKAVTFELSDPRVKHAVHPPDRDAGMPYKYAVNLGDGTPVYRRVLSIEERKKYEPDLAPPPPRSGDEKEEEEAPPEGDSKDAGADAAAAPKPRLKDFKGKGVLVRKLGRGFIVGLDHEFKAAGAHWWRTTFGFAVPHEKLMLKPASTKLANGFFGDAPLVTETDGGESVSGMVGFVVNEGVREITLGDDGKLGWGKELPKRTSVLLTGRETTSNGTRLHETANRFWVRLGDLKLAKPTPPADLAPNEKWIDVDLTRQTLVAFEGARPVFATLVSSGRRNPTDKEKDFPTPTGSYRIREKHVTTTMDGDVASDGPYSIEDVPWVMYFQGSYALHGAFWHDQFGHMRSHGCVNLAPEDARAIFAWSDPQLPPGWHGVFAADEKSGTRVVIHEDAPPKRH